jgi:hypothetical protein
LAAGLEAKSEHGAEGLHESRKDFFMALAAWLHKTVSMKARIFSTRRGRGAARLLLSLLCFGLAAINASLALAQTGAPLSVDTDSDFYKSNQSKVFYHDGKWWALAILTEVSDWYIWKHDAGTNTWTPATLVTTSSSRIPDALLDADNNRLFVMLSHDSKPDFLRFSYSGGVWTIDGGFPLRLSDFTDDDANRVSLVRAKNGKLWLFRIAGTSLQAKNSADNGATWSAAFTVKNGLNNSGVTDAVAFTAAAENYVGVAYGEQDATGSRFGFLKHRDVDTHEVWTDESASLTLSGSAHATNEISLTADDANNLFLLTQNLGASSGEANNTLFKRSASNNTWQAFSVNTSAAWKSPALALHPGNDALHVMGINLATLQAEYKSCAVGSESNLASAPAEILFSDGTGNDDFADLSVPSASNFGAATTLMVCADNTQANDIWFNELGATPGGGGGSSATLVGNVSLSTSEANVAASYTIPLTLGDGGALASGAGTITLQFPNNTLVPGSIATSEVSVNGNNAASVATNSSTREATITTPVSLADSATVTIIINASAGLSNPSHAGNYALQARTSAQATPATSPSYAITATTSQVSVASVTPTPNTTSSAASYAIAFNLGSKGRLFAGASTITLTFNNATSVANGSLSGAQVNGVSATASGNSGNQTVTLTAPASLALDNNASVTINLPSGITNPSSAASYTLTVATSVETTPVTSNAYNISGAGSPPPSLTGDDYPIAGSAGGYNKPNQNRPFYHDGHWWTAARKSSDGHWYLWKLTGDEWSATLKIDDRSSTRPDCYMDAANNKLYVLLASTSSSGTKLSRLSYSGGSFSIDGGFPTTLSNFTFSGEYCMVLTKAKNGDLWAFRYRSSKVEAMKSSNNGASWSSIITVKSGIESSGLVDAVTFIDGGEDYVGVGFGENTGSGSIYGFLKHKDGDADGAWSDETSDLPALYDAESDDHISLAVGPNNEIYFVVKTHSGGGSSPGIALYKRGASGGWSAYNVQFGGGWTRPAVVVDETNNEVYVMGTQEGSPENTQYKKCAIGNESSLADADPVDLMDNGGFNNLSAPRDRVNASSGLLVCAEDQGGNEIWYSILPIAGGGGGGSTPLAVNSVTVNPNTENLSAAYTIGLTLGSSGELSDNSDTITITWPSGTTIPSSIATNAITVNGSNASAVLTTPASRQVAVTVPDDLADGASVSLVFLNSAGIVNPSAGTYTLQARTSVEPSNVASPNYSIAAAPSSTPLAVNSVSVTPDTVSRTAQYTINLTLGNLGALAANTGTITITWPSNTSVPASMLNTAVLVNGASAASAVTNSVNRTATVTVPNALANGANVTLIFESSAGVVNPTSAGSYTLQAQTSAQASNVTSPSYTLHALPAPPSGGNAGSLLSAATDATLDRSGQGKLFFLQNKWWLIAFDSAATDWHLWKFQSGAWTRDLKVDSRAPLRIDAVLDSANSKLYYVASHEKNTKVGRLAYNGSVWSEEMTASVTDFGHGKNSNALSLARANNGELWLFRINVNALEAKVSTNNGASWSTTLVLKSNLDGTNGAVDGVTFRANGVNRVGVFYGMTAANGGDEYGFLHHEDGVINTSWVDESANLTFFNGEAGDNWFHAQATPQGKIYLLTRNSNINDAGAATNTLYERAANGAWAKHKVTVNDRWNSPVVAIDAGAQRVYVFGVRNGSPNFVEYKSCAFGSEASLETQTATAVLKKDNNNFGDLAGPLHPVYASMGLMLCGGNVTTNDVWHNQFISAAPKFAANGDDEAAAFFSGIGPEVSVYPNPFNPATTIRFRLHEAARVRLRIFNVRGALVRNLLDRDLHPGIFESRWNGKDREGQTVASGLYFYRLEINDKVLRGRLEMVK